MHAFYSPSSMGVQVKCSGYAAMVAEYPSISGPAALEGEAAHWAAEQRLRDNGEPLAAYGTAANGVAVTQEMIDETTEYVNSCISIPGEPHVEETVQIPRIHATNCFGTPDFWCLCPGNMTLYVKDFKYGRVAVKEFWQLFAYACGIIDLLQVPDTQLNVHLEIHQPRAWCLEGRVRSWSGPATDLRPFINQMYNACNHEPTLTSGSHCRYCDARLKCPANHNAAMNAVDVSNWPMNEEQTDQPRELDILRRAAEVLNNRLAALEAELIEQISNGQSVSGWALQNGRGSTVWNQSNKEVVTMGSLLGVDLRSDKPITPLQAKKRGLSAELVDSLSSKKPGKMMLIKSENTISHSVFSGGN